jgi:hypothetical protein
VPRRLPEEMEGKELVPLCLAIKLVDAKSIESVLDKTGIEYTFEITPINGKSILSILFGNIKKGVMFLVESKQYEYCRSALEKAGLYHLILD